jgi:hypothetical protein
MVGNPAASKLIVGATGTGGHTGYLTYAGLTTVDETSFEPAEVTPRPGAQTTDGAPSKDAGDPNSDGSDRVQSASAGDAPVAEGNEAGTEADASESAGEDGTATLSAEEIASWSQSAQGVQPTEPPAPGQEAGGCQCRRPPDELAGNLLNDRVPVLMGDDSAPAHPLRDAPGSDLQPDETGNVRWQSPQRIQPGDLPPQFQLNRSLMPGAPRPPPVARYQTRYQRVPGPPLGYYDYLAVSGMAPGYPGMAADALAIVSHAWDAEYREVAWSALALVPVLGDALVAKRVAGLAVRGSRAAAVAAEGTTEVVQRAMSRAELEATLSSGLLRGGRGGTHYVADAVNSTATGAQSRLALPVRPEVRVTLEVPAGRFTLPSRVQPYEVAPGQVLPGGGMERTATGPVQVRVLSVEDL